MSEPSTAASARATVLIDGNVLPMVKGSRPAQAIAIIEGRIAAVGANADAERAAGNGAERIDLRGATVIPGLIDTHPHLMHFGVVYATHVDLRDAKDHAEIVERIRQRAAVTPKGEWILTTPVGEPHYFIRRSWRDLAEGKLPDRGVLDHATTQHPVMLQAWAPVIPNVCAMNTEGLRKFGISRETPERVSNVWIEKDAAGDPTGILRGSVTNYYTGDKWWNSRIRELPRGGLQDLLGGTRAAMREYNALGVTTVYEGHVMDPPLIGAYRMLRAKGSLSVRVMAATEAESYVWPTDQQLTMDQYLAKLEEGLALVDLSDDLVRVNGITVERGGPCWPGFLLMRDPYKGPYGEMTNGVSFVSKEKIAAAIEFCATRGLRLNVIVAGTGEHDEFLDQLEAAASRHQIRGRHWILQHVFFMEPEQARRYGALGIDVTCSMSFSWGKGDMFAQRIGPQVLEHLIPLRRMIDAGMIVACGSDWGPKNIFEHVELALTHRFCGSGRINLGPAQRVTREEALAMWTREAARVLQWGDIGTLAPGKQADLVVVDRDPLTCPVDELSGTRVLRTLLGGKTVYESNAA